MARTDGRSVTAQLPLALPVFHILLALAEGERHGYALKREILRRTNGKVNLGAGALYGSISRMLERGLIEESEERPDFHLDDERRRYYRLTAAGQRAVKAEARRYAELAELARRKRLLGKPIRAARVGGLA